VRLREARDAAGLTQAELAESVGVTELAIRNYERRASSPTMERIVATAEALHVTIDWLLLGVAPMRAEHREAFAAIVEGLDDGEIEAVLYELAIHASAAPMPPQDELEMLRDELAAQRERLREMPRELRETLVVAIRAIKRRIAELEAIIAGGEAEEGRQVTFVEPPVQREGYVEQVYRTKEIRPDAPKDAGRRKRRAEGE